MSRAKWAISGAVAVLAVTAPVIADGATAGQSASATLASFTTGPLAGKILATSQLQALYAFSRDTPAASRCTGRCASVWVPLTTVASPDAAPDTGVRATLLGKIKRGGTWQVTYAGHPVYRFVGDYPQQVNGDHRTQFGGKWTVLNVQGGSPGPGNQCFTHPLCSY